METHIGAGSNDTFLPVRVDRLNKWRDHQPATRTRLIIIFSAGMGRAGGLNLAERALLAACECWSAVCSQALAWHLGSDPVDRLRSLASVYAAIGAKRTGRLMQLALSELLGAKSDAQRQQIVARLECVMLKTKATVDAVLRQLSLRLMPAATAHDGRPSAVAIRPHTMAPQMRLARPNPAADLLVAASVRWRTEDRLSRQHNPGRQVT